MAHHWVKENVAGGLGWPAGPRTSVVHRKGDKEYQLLIPNLKEKIVSTSPDLFSLCF